MLYLGWNPKEGLFHELEAKTIERNLPMRAADRLQRGLLLGDGLADDPFPRLAQTSSSQDKALADAVAKQPWDPSIQVLAGLPKGVKRLADDIQWTTDLGNAFLAQQSDVMDAVRRMRKKAQDQSNVKFIEQQVVEIKVVENKSCVTVAAAAWTNGRRKKSRWCSRLGGP